MPVSILVDELPQTICGVRFNAGYKNIVRFFEIQESDKSDEVKTAEIVKELFPQAVPNSPFIWDEVRRFITMGEEPEESCGEQVFDFRQDAGRIYASFKQAYGIDLVLENVHWWVFLELFKALPDDTVMKKVIEIRTRKPEAGWDAKQRLELVRLQERFALKGKQGIGGSVLGQLFRE